MIGRFFSRAASLARFVIHVYGRRRIDYQGVPRIGRNVKLLVEPGGRLVLGARVVLKEGTVIYVKRNARVTFGSRTSTGHHTEISANREIWIGDDVIMGAYVYITDSDHAFSRPDVPIREQGMDVGTARIGSNVWLGRGAFVLKDSAIGDDSVVAANSVVTKRFPGRELLGGVPARRIREIQPRPGTGGEGDMTVAQPSARS